MSTSLWRAIAATRAAARPARAAALSGSAPSRKDLVQELYLKELKAYKAPPATADAHVGAVHVFKAPGKPAPPALPASLAADLAAYDADEPQLVDAPVRADVGHAGGAPAFLEALEKDVQDVHH